jgi:hypothetical protein
MEDMRPIPSYNNILSSCNPRRQRRAEGASRDG